jgi:type III secretion protein R
MSSFENTALLALVALLPLVVLTLTSFVKLSVVLSLLRNAIGSSDAPSGLVIMGISLVLTFFVMAPVAVDMVQAAGTAPTEPTAPDQRGPGPVRGAARGTDPPPGTATAPGTATGSGTANATGAATQAGTASRAGTAVPADRDIDAAVRALVPAAYAPQVAAAGRALGPLRAFLQKHSRDADRQTFRELAAGLGSRVSGDEVWVLAPAFIATELREAFLIAVLIFVPFLVIDLVVALSLAALGLNTMSPQVVALPLKLVLFVAVDGWRLLLEALLRGYA